MPHEPDNAMCYVRPDSDQLFFLFTGLGEGLNIHPLDFIRQTGIGSRNIVIFHDPHRACYREGISKEYDSLDGIVRWQRERLADRFAHVREVFCAGSSGGAFPAIYTGYRLGAKAAWSFAGCVAMPSVIAERERTSIEISRKVTGRSRLGKLTEDERARLAQTMDQPEMRQLRQNLCENPDMVLDWERINHFVGLLRDTPNATQLHLYYVPTNPLDRPFAEAFRGCPQVTIHPLTDPRGEEPAPKHLVFYRIDHEVVVILQYTGNLPGVFSSYLQPSIRPAG